MQRSPQSQRGTKALRRRAPWLPVAFVALLGLAAGTQLSCAPPEPKETTPKPRESADHGRPASATDIGAPVSLGPVGTLTGRRPRERASAGGTLGRMGRLVDIRPFYRHKKKFLEVQDDLRAHLTFPVNVIRIYSGQHKADAIATEGYIKTQIQLMNRMFQLRQADMSAYGPGKPAPILQFRLNRIYSVHEDQFTKVLGFRMDTESLMMSGKRHNGERVANTWDVRSVKIKGETSYMTIYWAYAGRAGSTVGRWGGVSNVGFADLARPKTVGVLTRVSGRRAYMGPIIFRVASPSTLAHEVGHYFDLPHAWEHSQNRSRRISDVGTGPQTNVDGRSDTDNAMDYGRAPKQYFTHQQLAHMYRYALKKAPELLTVWKGSGGPAPRPRPVVEPRPRPTPRPVVRPRPTVAEPRPRVTPRPVVRPRPAVVRQPTSGTVERVWIDPPTPGGKVVVHARFRVAHATGAGDVVVWFQDANGQMLQDTDGRFRTRSGHVAMGATYRARGASTRLADLSLTLPAGQLHLGPGSHSLAVVVGLFHGGRFLVKTSPTSFKYSVVQPPRRPTTRPVVKLKRQVKIEKVWITHGEQRGSERGLLVKARLSIRGYKDARLLYSAWFFDSRGRKLRDTDRRYATPGRQVASSVQIKPIYENAVFPSCTVFIPYGQLHLGAGKHQVKVAVGVSQNGALQGALSKPVAFTVDPVKPPPRDPFAW